MCNRPKIFLLEGLDEEEVEQEASEWILAIIQQGEAIGEEKEVGELLGISLYAIVGSLSQKTTRVEGIINSQKVLIFIDIGSIHSFVDPYGARKSRLPVGES